MRSNWNPDPDASQRPPRGNGLSRPDPRGVSSAGILKETPRDSTFFIRDVLRRRALDGFTERGAPYEMPYCLIL